MKVKRVFSTSAGQTFVNSTVEAGKELQTLLTNIYTIILVFSFFS